MKFLYVDVINVELSLAEMLQTAGSFDLNICIRRDKELKNLPYRRPVDLPVCRPFCRPLGRNRFTGVRRSVTILFGWVQSDYGARSAAILGSI
jgi:hypothetical protein